MSNLLGRFDFFRKFAEIFANEFLSPVSGTPAIPAINLSLVTTTPVIRVCAVSMDVSFRGGGWRYRRFRLN